jgi:hypothetical protein
MPLPVAPLLVLLTNAGCWPDRPESISLLDLTQRLGPGEVLAGVIHDEGALFGGVSAEGEAGDIKIYNDRVRFVIQGAREGSYYVPNGGGVLDADIVRGFGQPGQDIIDEAAVMVGFGRLMNAETVEVIHDGTDGQPAVVRSIGPGNALELLGGAVETAGIPVYRDVEIQTDYTLAPDTYLLQMDTTVRWMDQSTLVQLADMVFVAYDVAGPYLPGLGPDGALPSEFGWTGAMGHRNEVAVAIMQREGDFVTDAILETIGSMSPLLIAANTPVTLADGDVISTSRYLGVAPDFGTLTDAWHAANGDAVETVAGSVTASGYAVPGARVHVIDAEERTLTMALSGPDGLWSADIPAGSGASAVATGRGPAIDWDLPIGAGWFSAYAAPPVRLGVMAAMRSGAEPIDRAIGYGISGTEPAGANTALTLTRPGTLNVSLSDGGPAVVRVDFADGETETEYSRLAMGRPSGAAAWLYIKDGEGSVDIEPGEYTVVVHRGARYDPFIRSVNITGGETAHLDAVLDPVTVLPGIWAADPHSHGAPSGDGGLPMEGRLITHAAHGIDVHFGTDHDHIADYRVLLEPLKLDGVLASIVAAEVSPVLRGHINAYPLEEAPDELNHGAVQWWRTWQDWVDTAGLFQWIRSMPSDGSIIVQANHPAGPGGLLGAAGHNPEEGTIDNPDKWSPDFDAMEILNDGQHDTYVVHYLDLVNRGLDPVPVGVSDSHNHRGGVGQNMTWVPIDVADMGELTPDHIREAWESGGTVPSTGPIIEARAAGEWAPGQTFTGKTPIDLVVWAPDWMAVDALHIYENGVVIDTLSVEDSAPIRLDERVVLNPIEDAVYVFEVTGDSDMSPVYPGAYPWAMTAAIKIDTEGDGWTPPLPSLRFQ